MAAAMMRTFFKRLGSIAGGFCAAFLGFAVVFGAVGAAIAVPVNAADSCWPHHSAVYLFESFCEDTTARAAWWGTVEFARAAVSMPALSIYAVYDSIARHPYSSLVIGPFVWAVSALVVFAVWVGFRHLRARLPAVAWALLAAYVVQAAAIAWPVELSVPVQHACKEDRGNAYVRRYFSYLSAFTGDAYVRGPFTYHLDAMGEAPLSCGALPDDETYRFVWLRSFEDPVAIRVYRRGGAFGLVAVVLDRDDDFGVGRVKKRVAKALSPAEWRRVLAVLDEVAFWRMRTSSNDLFGIDGATWGVEGRRAGRYHVAGRWGAYALEPVGTLFIELADLGDVGMVY
jgi:hypothetical protein